MMMFGMVHDDVFWSLFSSLVLSLLGDSLLVAQVASPWFPGLNPVRQRGFA
jgi:hypothetical protein